MTTEVTIYSTPEHLSGYPGAHSNITHTLTEPGDSKYTDTVLARRIRQLY